MALGWSWMQVFEALICIVFLQIDHSFVEIQKVISLQQSKTMLARNKWCFQRMK